MKIIFKFKKQKSNFKEVGSLKTKIVSIFCFRTTRTLLQRPLREK